MPESLFIVKCPYCGCDTAATPPDSSYREYSFVELSTENIRKEYKKRQVDCENPECKKAIVIYWRAQEEYSVLLY